MIMLNNLSLVMDEFLGQQHFVSDAEKNGSAQIVGIRGAKIVYEKGKPVGISVGSNPNALTDNYGDVFFVYGKKTGGERYSAIYKTSTEPGYASCKLATYRPADKGCPVIQQGQFKYQKGSHKGKAALIQAGPVVVVRDLDDNYVIDESDMWDYPRWTGINIHAGGLRDYVGLNSSGCQVVYGGWYGQYWRQFKHLIYNVAGKQFIYHYTVINGNTFGKWFDSPDNEKASYRWLWYGSKGEIVTTLQKELKNKGFYYASGIDGYFGVETHKAVRRYQKAMGCKQTGIVNKQLIDSLNKRGDIKDA